MATLVREAQELGRRGFRVHPLKAKDQPYTKYSQTATSDPDAIAVLWQYFPNALIGICTGSGFRKLSGELATLVVVDDDRRTGFDESLPMTLTASTPKGGYHHYFYTATPVRNSTSKIAQGIDIRGEGGYVVAPPSEGREWWPDEPWASEIAPLPGVLLAACLRTEPQSGTFEPRSHVPAGERHDYLVRLAGWLIANEMAEDWEDCSNQMFDHAMQVCEDWPTSELRAVRKHMDDIAKWVIARESTDR